MLNNLKMATKLSLGFGLILVIMIISLIISLNRMAIVNEQSSIITKNWMPSIKVTEEINTNTSDLRIAEYAHVLAQNDDAMKKAEDVMNSVLSTMKENRNNYEKLISSSEEQAIYDKFSKKFDKYMESNKQLLLVSRQNKTEEAQKILNNNQSIFDDYSRDLAELVKINVDGGNKASSTGDEIYEQAKNIIIFMIILSIILGIGAAFLITKSIISSLTTFQDGLFSFFGYLNRESVNVQLIKIDSKDEFGNMAKIVNQNIQKTQKGIEEDRKLIDETITVLNQFEQGDLSQRLNISVSNQALMELRNVLNNMATNIETNINNVLNILEQYSHYNYLNKIPTNNVKEHILKLATGVNTLGDSITNMLVENKSNGLTLDESSNILLKNVDKLNVSSNEAAASLEETAAALEEITSNIRNTTDNIAKMSNFSSSVTKSATSGEKLANKTTVSMDEINHQVNLINDAISVIDQIAFQTNILSLNAAVEAATAGEAGKGFAVVAQEVRNLASRSAEAAKEIKNIVENAKNKADEGKSIAGHMIEGYKELNESIQQTINLISDIEMSSKEQLTGIEQINDAINQLDQQTQQNAQIASQTHDVAIITDEIAKLVVSDANTKEFNGKNQVKAKSLNIKKDSAFDIKANEINYKKSSQKKTYTKIEQHKTITPTNNNDEWESF